MSDRPKVLITGSRGRLGSELVSVLQTDHEICTLDREDCDICDTDAVAAYVAAAAPGTVLHTIAWTDVDACERNPQLADAVNCGAVENVALACRDTGARMIHFSTDYVFDGAKGKPYFESDKTNPLSVYGRTKLEGEMAVENACNHHIIVRVARLYSERGGNFLRLLIHRAAEQMRHRKQREAAEPLRVIDDQIGNPTWTLDVARQVAVLMGSDISGIVHCVAEGEVSRYRFALELFDLLRWKIEVRSERETSLIPRAVRPPYSSLANSRLKRAGLCRMRPYRAALIEFLQLHGKTLTGDA